MADAIVSQGSKIEIEHPRTVTISIANPAVVSDVGHNLIADTPVVLTTTGALPTGLVAGTTYYVKTPIADAYNLAATPGGAAIVTTGTQSGIHTATALLNVLGLQGTPQLSISNTLVEITDLQSSFREH